MRTYAAYASVYDAAGQARAGLMAMERALAEVGPPGPGRALDMGCGTGAALLALARAGWDAAGLDRSPAMLSIAAGRARDAGVTLALAEGDICSPADVARAAGGRPFDLALCLGDTLSEQLGEMDLAGLARSAASALAPGGALAIDMRAPAEFESWDSRDEVLFDSGGLLLWAHRDYRPRSRRAASRYCWMSRAGERWWREEESHPMRCWPPGEVADALSAAGLTPRAALALAPAPRADWSGAPAEAPAGEPRRLLLIAAAP